MSSQAARTAILAAITPLASPWPVYNASDYNEFEEIMNGVSAEVVVVQFMASDDQLQSIGGEGNQCWEETGNAIIHMLVPTGFDSGPVVDKGDTIREGLRGSRIANDVVIESVSPFVDFGGAVQGVNGPVHGWTSNAFYERRSHG
jgi:hypothetical protein